MDENWILVTIDDYSLEDRIQKFYFYVKARTPEEASVKANTYLELRKGQCESVCNGAEPFTDGDIFLSACQYIPRSVQ